MIVVPSTLSKHPRGKMAADKSLCIFLFFLSLYQISFCEDGIKILNDESFEHLTQASSGATTGDWLIAFTKDDPNCELCKQIDEVFSALHKKLGHKVVLAKILDEKYSVLTWKRFEVLSLPKVLLLRGGFQYYFTGDKYTEDSLTTFIDNYNKSPNRRVPVPIGFLDVYIETVMSDIKHVIHIRKNAAAIIFCSGALFGLLLTPVLKCIGDFLISTFAQEPECEEEREDSEGVDEVDEEEDEKEDGEKKND